MSDIAQTTLTSTETTLSAGKNSEPPLLGGSMPNNLSKSNQEAQTPATMTLEEIRCEIEKLKLIPAKTRSEGQKKRKKNLKLYLETEKSYFW